MPDEIQNLNQNLNSEQYQNENQEKPKNFWQRLKMWQKIGIIVFILVLTYVMIIPLLFCTNIDFDFSKNPEYISCYQDSNCIAKTCGCLNEKGAKKFSLWTIFCGGRLMCIIPSSCVCQNGQCVNNYDYDNDILEDMSLVTNKTEYQKGEEVKLTVRNNLDEEIEFCAVVAEKFNNDEWEEIRFDIECLGLCMKIQTVINSKNNKSFLWDQKDNIGLQIETGKFRFRIKIYNDGILTVPPPSIYYSNEFTIKSDSDEVGELDYCQEDSDCVARISHCDCQYHCVNKKEIISDCDTFCYAISTVIPECVCKNNKCIDKKFLECDEKKVILKGKLNIVHSKYPINVIETSENTYWMYETPKNFEENLNKIVRMEAIISPANGKCNICYRKCPNCQCPVGELLYGTKILEILE